MLITDIAIREQLPCYGHARWKRVGKHEWASATPARVHYEQEGLMDVVTMTAAVAVVTEFLKKALAKVNVTLKGAAAVVLSVVVTIGVVMFYAIQTGAAWNFQLVVYVLEVAIAANMGYQFLELAGGEKTRS